MLLILVLHVENRWTTQVYKTPSKYVHMRFVSKYLEALVKLAVIKLGRFSFLHILQNFTLSCLLNVRRGIVDTFQI